MKILTAIRSARGLLTLWYSLILIAAFAILGSSTYFYLQHMLLATLDRNMLDEAEWITELIELEIKQASPRISPDSLSDEIVDVISDHFSSNPRNYIIKLSTVQGTMLYESDNRVEQLTLPRAVNATATIIETIRDSEQNEIRLVTRQIGNFISYIAFTDEAIQSVLWNLLRTFGILLPGVLILSISGGWMMAGLVLRPVRKVSTTAERITASNLSERIPERTIDDELGKLIHTMNAMISRLEASFKQIREFTMGVAHELRTPLTILKGESELALGKTLAQEETQGLILTYLEETNRLSRIVDDLLTLAKAEAGQIIIQKEPINLEPLIKEIYEDVIILSSDKQLQVELVSNEPAVIIGDATRLRQLFRILITNAVRYTDTGGKIQISSNVVGGTVHITVEDNGIGIPEESLEKIFDKFYRVDEARSRSSGGSGLGLAIAKFIIEAHKGSVSVKSTLAEGSRFVVSFPIYRH